MCISINQIDAFFTVLTSNNKIPDTTSIDLDTLYEHSFLSAPPPFIRTQSYDLSKPPNSYHEALNRPDNSVWLAAMQREVDSLEE